MKKQLKIQAILKEFADLNTVPEVSKAVNHSPETVRVYANYMTNNGLLEKVGKGNVGNTGRPKFAYYATGIELTNEIMQKIQMDIYFHYENMKKGYADKQYQAQKQAKIKAIEFEKIEGNLEKSDDEKKGIYRLSTSPSKYFKEKFKAQNQQSITERVSPKNYAGTTAGMVW